MIKSIKHKALKNLHTRGISSGLTTHHLRRIKMYLDVFDTIKDPNEMNHPGTGFHRLKGDRKGQFSLSVTKHPGMVFEWDGDDVVNVDLLDYL